MEPLKAPLRRTVPAIAHILKRERIRNERAGKGTSDPRWARDIMRKISMGDLEGAMADWHLERLGARDLVDLRNVSRKLMRAFNNERRWLDTIRFFKWNEEAEIFDERGARRMGDVILLQSVGYYLAGLDSIMDRQLPPTQVGPDMEQGDQMSKGTEVLGRVCQVGQQFREGGFFEVSRDTISRSEKPIDEDIDITNSTEGVEVSEIDSNIPGAPAKKTGIDGPLLDLCLKALLARLDSERVLTLIARYKDRIEFTRQTWEYGIAAHLNLGESDKARDVIMGAHLSKKPVSHACYTMILHSVKAEGVSWEKLVNTFQWLEKLTAAKVPELYHVMVQAAIERGMKENANEYLLRMKSKRLPHTAKTCGCVMAAQAITHDWEGVQRTMELFEKQGFRIPTGAFNALLDTIAQYQVYSDTENLFHAGLKRGIVPNNITYNIMLSAAVYAGGEGERLIPLWLGRMMENGIKPDEYTFNTLLRDLRVNYGASASLLRRAYQKILRMQTSIPVLDSVSKEQLLKTQHHEAKLYPATYTVIRPDDIMFTSNHEAYELRMASALEGGKPEDALVLWKHFLKTKNNPSFHMDFLAMRACVMSKRTSAVPAILAFAKRQGFDIPDSIVNYIRESTKVLTDEELTDVYGTQHTLANPEKKITLKLDKIYARVEEFYRFLDSNSLRITHHAAVHYAHQLNLAGEYYTAIQLMNQVAQTKWGKAVPFDTVGLTVILFSYCKTSDLNGVKWVMDRIIALRYIPTPGILQVLRSLHQACELKARKDEVIFVSAIMRKLRMHRETMVSQAEARTAFIVKFMAGAVGLRVQRRYGVNWPLVTRNKDGEYFILWKEEEVSNLPEAEREVIGSLGG